ncbi:hypothetical protein ABK040_009529 [Willaertia magna]
MEDFGTTDNYSDDALDEIFDILTHDNIGNAKDTGYEGFFSDSSNDDDYEENRKRQDEIELEEQAKWSKSLAIEEQQEFNNVFLPIAGDACEEILTNDNCYQTNPIDNISSAAYLCFNDLQSIMDENGEDDNNSTYSWANHSTQEKLDAKGNTFNNSSNQLDQSIINSNTENAIILGENNFSQLLGCNDISISSPRLISLQEFSNGIGSSQELFQLSSISEVLSGYYHTFIRTVDGNIYGVGSNFHGQLGLGKEIEQTNEFKKLNFFNENNLKVKNIYTKYLQTFFVTDKGKLFTCGYNEECNLGINKEGTKKANIFDITQVKGSVNDLNIKKVGIGHYHVIILTEDSQVFVCGLQLHGALFLPTNNKRLTKLTKNENMSRRQIINVECGQYYSVAVSRDGKFYVAGVISEVTRPIFEVYSITNMIPKLLSCDTFEHTCCVSNDYFILSVSALTEPGSGDLELKEKVFRWGDNSNENSVPNVFLKEITNTVTQSLREPIRTIVNGPYHTLFITKGGRAFHMGRNNNSPQSLLNQSDSADKPELLLITTSFNVHQNLATCTKEGIILLANNAFGF